MNLTDLLLIIGLTLLIWFWLESMKVNEKARVIGARLCIKNNVQFLDDTVHLSSMKIGKNNYGQIRLLRKYKFEFTNSEYHRYNGELTLVGQQLLHSHMDIYQFNDIDINH